MHQFRFECQPGCTACCETEGEVRLTSEDIRRASAFLGIPSEVFVSTYTTGAGTLSGLRCPFLGPNGCAIHPAKPTQCRLYPFWPEIVETRQAWHRTVRTCPGIGKGPLIQIADAVAIAAGMKEAFPDSYVQEPAPSPSRKRRMRNPASF
ncbi:MAG: YkgJ family cysteine cluster protein [Bryobacterales bacterium]|nr:YkgJ family cysteine cluster protein [Bryobacterales bacterium]